MADPRLDIHIRTQADTTGAKAAAAAVKQASDATKEAGKAAQQTARNVNEAGESFEKGAAAGAVLAGALQGNVYALTQLGPAIKALGAALKANVIGVLITLGGLLASTVIPLIGGFRKKLDETKDSAEAADKALQLRKEAIEEAGKAINDLAKEADAAEKKLRALQTRNDAIADAQLGLELAQIRAREDIDEPERLRLETEARDRREVEKRRTASQTNAAIVAAQRAAQERAVGGVADAETALREAAQGNAQLAGRRSIFEGRIREAEQATASNPIEAAANLRRLNDARKDLRDFEASLVSAGEQSQLLAQQLLKAREALAQVSERTGGRIEEIEAQEQLDTQLFQIGRQTTQVTRATAARRAPPPVDTSGLLSQRETLAAEAARLQAEASGGDFSFGGALKRSAAAEALDRNRQEMARVDAEFLAAQQQNHVAQMEARRLQTKQEKTAARDHEKLTTQVKNTRQ